MNIYTATDWQLIRRSLEDKITNIGSPRYSRDYEKFLNNIDHMVRSLSKLEVSHRHNPEHWSLVETRAEIDRAVDTLEKYIIFNSLC